jgi:hypothetical protein
MYLKIMSGENKKDNSIDKGFQLIECDSASFRRKDGKSFVVITKGDRLEDRELLGNAYVLNNTGKTIEAFWAP